MFEILIPQWPPFFLCDYQQYFITSLATLSANPLGNAALFFVAAFLSVSKTASVVVHDTREDNVEIEGIESEIKQKRLRLGAAYRDDCHQDLSTLVGRILNIEGGIDGTILFDILQGSAMTL